MLLPALVALCEWSTILVTIEIGVTDVLSLSHGNLRRPIELRIISQRALHLLLRACILKSVKHTRLVHLELGCSCINICFLLECTHFLNEVLQWHIVSLLNDLAKSLAALVACQTIVQQVLNLY